LNSQLVECSWPWWHHFWVFLFILHLFIL